LECSSQELGESDPIFFEHVLHMGGSTATQNHVPTFLGYLQVPFFVDGNAGIKWVAKKSTNYTK